MTTTTHATEKDTNGTAAARDVAANVGATAKDVAARLPEAADAAGVQLNRASERMQRESDEVLTVGTTLSLGLAMGLFLGGANRILVMLAMIPAAAMGYTLFDRHSGSRRMRSS